jgi:hypothetical protein
MPCSSSELVLDLKIANNHSDVQHANEYRAERSIPVLVHSQAHRQDEADSNGAERAENDFENFHPWPLVVLPRGVHTAI